MVVISMHMWQPCHRSSRILLKELDFSQSFLRSGAPSRVFACFLKELDFRQSFLRGGAPSCSRRCFFFQSISQCGATLSGRFLLSSPVLVDEACYIFLTLCVYPRESHCYD